MIPSSFPMIEDSPRSSWNSLAVQLLPFKLLSGSMLRRGDVG